MHCICRFLCIAILLFAGGVFCAIEGVAAQSAASGEKGAAAVYSAAAKEWRELLRDEKRGSQREPWLKLERRFLAAESKAPKGDTGARARYQAARCREELAKHSRLAADWQQAVTHYLALAKEYPKHNLADDGLFQAAFIMANHLRTTDNARKTAQAVIDRYPRGDMVSKARGLLVSLPQTPAPVPIQAAPSPAPTRAASTPARETADQTAKAAATSAPASRLTRILCRGTSKRASVILELDGAASFRHQYLAPSGKNPARLVVDIDAVSMGPEVKPGMTPSGMAVSRVRTALSGARGKQGVRVVIDVDKIRHYTVDAGASPPGIHVQCSVAEDLPGGKSLPANKQNGPVVQGRYSGTESGRPGTLMEQLGLTVKTIMLDAGHGGKDPGAMGNGIKESAVTLNLAKLLGQRLEKQGFNVLYTREKDTYVALDQRAVIANNKKADLFISLHVNASRDKNIHGLETYFLDLARTSSAATVAARENAVSVKSISDLQFILTDLMLTSKLQESQDLAAVVHHNMYGRVRKAGFAVADNGVRSAPFYVLMGARMPAVLVEIGYLTHDGDVRRLASSKYLERLADGITLGVVEYKNKLARFNR